VARVREYEEALLQHLGALGLAPTPADARAPRLARPRPLSALHEHDRRAVRWLFSLPAAPAVLQHARARWGKGAEGRGRERRVHAEMLSEAVVDDVLEETVGVLDRLAAAEAARAEAARAAEEERRLTAHIHQLEREAADTASRARMLAATESPGWAPPAPPPLADAPAAAPGGAAPRGGGDAEEGRTGGEVSGELVRRLCAEREAFLRARQEWDSVLFDARLTQACPRPAPSAPRPVLLRARQAGR
jgi:hypothetical protein